MNEVTENKTVAIIRVCIPTYEVAQLRAEAEEAGETIEFYAGFLLTTAILRHREQPKTALGAAVLESVQKRVSELHALANLVDEMRTAQRGYFAAKSGEPAKKIYWVKAIKLEQAVDAQLRAILQPEAPPLSKGLFP